jgi:hypothetical protein
MKNIKLLFLLAALPALYGCASFNSGDMLVDRNKARAMLEDKSVVPFAEIEVSWKNFPYRAPTDSIGEGSASRTRKIRPVQVDAADEEAFVRKTRDIFTKAGLYDRDAGRGKLRLELTSFGRWTYSDLWRSFLVDTGFIFIIPASLRVNYYLTADFAVEGGTVRVETEARNKTTFHLLLAPLYPLFSPGAKESGLLKQMLWRSATDVYSRLKASGAAAGPLPPKPPESAGDDQPMLGPPVQPDRTWLPGQGPESAPAVPPVKPDQTWTVTPAAAQAAEVKVSPQPQQPAPQPAPAAPAEDEPLDD